MTKRSKRRRGSDSVYDPKTMVAGGGAPVDLDALRRERRHRGHPHTLANGADLHRHPMPDKGKTRAPRPSQVTSGHAAMVTRNLTVLAQIAPELVRPEADIYIDKLAEGKRPAFAALEAHKDMAAVILAAGGTFEEAADHAGVTPASVARYIEDENFRARVNEMRALVLSQVQGRTITELARRTEPGMIEELELTDVLRIFDRTQPIGAKAAATKASTDQQSAEDRYQNIVNVLVAANSPTQSGAEPSPDGRSEDRPVRVIGPGGDRLAGDSPSGS